jgi:putative redox protein
VICAARYLRQNHSAPQILIGHSLGGAAVLAAVTDIPEVRAVATIGAPYEASHVKHLLTNAEELVEKGEATVDIGGRPFHIRKEFIEDLERHDPSKTIAALGRALLILHSPQDRIVPIENAAKIFMAAKHPKSFISLDKADHLLTDPANAAYAAEVLAAWASRYLEPVQHEGQKNVEGVRIVETRQGKFAQDVYAGPHRLRADEPVAAGGDDSAPTPYDLLVAALGTCTAMTIRLYADAKQIPLERVIIDLKHGKVHAADCAECETREGKVDRIDRVITLEGELDAAQREKLLEIANKCPVHRTLQSEIWIPTSLAN